MLQMVLHGPSASAMECYGWSCMGQHWPETVLRVFLAWAQCWPQCILLMVLHGPSAAPHSMLPMILHGPIPGHPACYRWSCVGLALAPKRATDGIVWAHCWPQRMLQMVLHGPSASTMECYGWSCMVRSLAQSVL